MPKIPGKGKFDKNVKLSFSATDTEKTFDIDWGTDYPREGNLIGEDMFFHSIYKMYFAYTATSQIPKIDLFDLWTDADGNVREVPFMPFGPMGSGDMGGMHKHKVFTGDASTTIFDFGEAPIFSGSVTVWFDGVIQTTGYSIDEAKGKLIFSSAPGNGVSIDVDYQSRSTTVEMLDPLMLGDVTRVKVNIPAAEGSAWVAYVRIFR